jgi:hypothetical protein
MQNHSPTNLRVAALGSEADVQINLPSSRGFEPVFPLEGSPRGDLLVTRLKVRRRVEL